MTKHVIWDWNGTLLDDVEHALHAVNALLRARKLPPIDRDGYRTRFGFPVSGFYTELGFDIEREDFAALSETYINHYRQVAVSATTHTEARDVMGQLQQQGIAQSVLSAMEINMLRQMLSDHGLIDLLTHVRGLHDQQASSKVALGVELMRTLGATPNDVLFVGDTLHDLETATAMGAHCLLFACGHQTLERLSGSGATVIHSLYEVIDFVRARN